MALHPIRTTKFEQFKVKVPEILQENDVRKLIDGIGGHVLSILDMNGELSSKDEALHVINYFKILNAKVVEKLRALWIENVKREIPTPFSWWKNALPRKRNAKFSRLKKEIMALITVEFRVFIGLNFVDAKEMYELISPLLLEDVFTSEEIDLVYTWLEKYLDDYKNTHEKYSSYNGQVWEKAVEILKEVGDIFVDTYLKDPRKREDLIRSGLQVAVYQWSIIFFFPDEEVYDFIGWWRGYTLDTSGMYFSKAVSKDLNYGNVIFVNGSMQSRKDVVVLHEKAHRKFIYVKMMHKPSRFDKVTGIFDTLQDEMIAFLEEDHFSKQQLIDFLIPNTSSYNPISKRWPRGRKPYRRLREYYEKYGEDFIDYAFLLKKDYPNIYPYILAVTPIEMWRFM